MCAPDFLLRESGQIAAPLKSLICGRGTGGLGVTEGWVPPNFVGSADTIIFEFLIREGRPLPYIDFFKPLYTF